MRIVLHDYGAYPFSVQLAHALSDRDNDVLYLYSAGFVTPKGPIRPRNSDAATLTIEAVDIGGTASRRAMPRRLLQERRYGRRLAESVISHRPDVVISANCPLDAQATALAAAHAAGAGFVFWMQDIYSHAVKRLLERKIPIVGGIAGAHFARLEQRLLRSADAVVAVSTDFLQVLREWRVAEDRICVIPNWAPLDETEPAGKVNGWAVEHGLNDVPVFVYAGTLGRKHDPGLLIALAMALPQAQMVVVSEGVGTDWLRRHATGMPNLHLLPLQPADRLAEVLGSADILVALLETDAAEFSVPSKVLTYLAAARPILAAIPAANLAAKTIAEAGAGIVVEPTNVDGFVTAARALLDDSEARLAAATRGRAYAMRAFDIGPITDRFESILGAARLHTVDAAHSSQTESSR